MLKKEPIIAFAPVLFTCLLKYALSCSPNYDNIWDIKFKNLRLSTKRHVDVFNSEIDILYSPNYDEVWQI